MPMVHDTMDSKELDGYVLRNLAYESLPDEVKERVDQHVWVRRVLR
jgi:hypothetical protein